MVNENNVINAAAIRSDLRRYRRASFDYNGLKFELTGTVRGGFNLWQLTPTSLGYQGFVREVVHQASSIDAILDMLQGEVATCYACGKTSNETTITDPEGDDTLCDACASRS
jgi:hypothetical protein